jgi:hypothetical protein
MGRRLELGFKDTKFWWIMGGFSHFSLGCSSHVHVGMTWLLRTQHKKGLTAGQP